MKERKKERKSELVRIQVNERLRACVYVCVCVHEREIEREIEREGGGRVFRFYGWVYERIHASRRHLFPGKEYISICHQ